MSSFVHLHVHSDYTIRGSIAPIRNLIRRAHDLRMPAMVLTDTGNLYGAFDFLAAAKRWGMKPILGCEVNVHMGMSAPSKVLVLARNANGYKNLTRLVSAQNESRDIFERGVDVRTFLDLAGGCIGIACSTHGALADAVASDSASALRRAVSSIAGQFKSGDFYIEVYPAAKRTHLDFDATNAILLELGSSLGLPLVAGNDVRYIDETDAPAFELLSRRERARGGVEESAMGDPGGRFVRSAGQMAAALPGFEAALEATLEIFDKCALEFDTGLKVPVVELPGRSTPHEHLRSCCLAGVMRRCGAEPAPEVLERMDAELAHIRERNLAAVFLLHANIAQSLDSLEILRGSGAGLAPCWLVNYLLGVTDIDPLKHGLLFERAFTGDPPGLPFWALEISDCFVDAASEMLNEAGYNDLARTLEFPRLDRGGALRRAQLVLRASEEMLEAAWAVDEGPNGMVAAGPELRELLDVASRYEGLVDRAALIGDTWDPAWAAVIPPGASSLLATGRREGVGAVVQCSSSGARAAGFAIIGFQGSTSLSVLESAVSNVLCRHGLDLDPESIPVDDSFTIAMLRAGRTAGVPDMEHLHDVFREAAPQTFADITALTAVGTMWRSGSTGLEALVARMRKRETHSSLHPAVAAALDETYGEVLYHEQIMSIARDVSRFSPAQTYELHRALARMDADRTARLRVLWREGGSTRGFSPQDLEDLWATLVASGSRATTKAFAVATAYRSMRIAYIKAHWWQEYLDAVREVEGRERAVEIEGLDRWQRTLMGVEDGQADLVG